MSNIITRLVGTDRDEVEFDFNHPVTGKRVRRKVKAPSYITDKVVEILESYVINDSHRITVDDLERYIRNDVQFNEHVDEILDACKILFFNYMPNERYVDRETTASEILDGIFTDKPDINILLLGKAGAGKSSIISKISFFADKGEAINFPFVDTSRTTAFAAEYLFVPKSHLYRCAVVFLAKEHIELRVEECIERAIYKAIEHLLKIKIDVDELADKVISAFYVDPSQLFDIRLCYGKHIKMKSKNYDKHENKDVVQRWKRISDSCIEIAKDVVGQSVSQDTSPQFYQEQFTRLIKTQNSDSSVLSLYKYLKDYTLQEIEATKERCYVEMEKNKAVSDFQYKDDFFQCKVALNSIEDFDGFISLFTSKAMKVFGHSIFPLVYKLKIEIPYNEQISDNLKSLKICCSDTIGVAHANEGKNGFERSTSLDMGNVHAAIIADDSKLNMDANTGLILRHIASRINCKDIYFALTFFDDFTKGEFDESEDMDEQKIEYLSNIQKEKVVEYLGNNENSRMINERTLEGKNTFYLKGLAQRAKPEMNSINCMLETIRQEIDIANSLFNVSKLKVNDPIIAFDYRKLSLHYAKAANAFLEKQTDEYVYKYPHFKTTEALTRRLSLKETFFHGARKLTPVDDFYHAITNEFSVYILHPEKINIDGKPGSVQQVLERIKTVATERIRALVHERFFSKSNLASWSNLYNDCGPGVDSRRREGILRIEKEIAPSEMEFLLQQTRTHVIDRLEEIFEASIKQVELEVTNKSQNLSPTKITPRAKP